MVTVCKNIEDIPENYSAQFSSTSFFLFFICFSQTLAWPVFVSS